MAFLYFSIVSCIRKYGNHCIILSRACQTYQLFTNKKLPKHGGKISEIESQLGRNYKGSTNVDSSKRKIKWLII